MVNRNMQEFVKQFRKALLEIFEEDFNDFDCKVCKHTVFIEKCYHCGGAAVSRETMRQTF